ncbi:hypothetical protein J2X31_002222 [Flavobacterium arsenatis]|uniref:Lipoprotein n=1 Tax=Flavobacterium arsenatis TaxID=1484332 RepID=A0ABU1TQG3_9FLAO|nr:hypothetical protein [Flavobacterium arsenatis]MDR6968207.1 hypothetical protein [Flavobacterium arsenatis]
MRSFFFITVFITLASFSTLSCKGRNYITYYNKANAIDSVYKINRDTIAFIKRYKKIYRKYNPPKSNGGFSKYETYIVFSDKYSKKFGGKKSVYKLLDLVAPYNEHYKTLFPLCEKYGIDSLSVEQKIASSKSKMNKRLIDSFSVAFVRDQKEERSDSVTMVKNDRKNARLLKWTIQNYGYPSPQKIGITGNDSVFMPMRTFLSHMAYVDEYYPFFKDELLKYVKSGECSPQEYATMVDRHERNSGREILYDEYFGEFSDTLKVNRNRRSIGLRSLNYNVKK